MDSMQVLLQLIDHSANARSTGSTGANDESSRSGGGRVAAAAVVAGWEGCGVASGLVGDSRS